MNTVGFFGVINQIAREVAVDKGNTLAENARLLALVDLGEADEAIACWDAQIRDTPWYDPVRAADPGLTLFRDAAKNVLGNSVTKVQDQVPAWLDKAEKYLTTALKWLKKFKEYLPIILEVLGWLGL